MRERRAQPGFDLPSPRRFRHDRYSTACFVRFVVGHLHLRCTPAAPSPHGPSLVSAPCPVKLSPLIALKFRCNGSVSLTGILFTPPRLSSSPHPSLPPPVDCD